MSRVLLAATALYALTLTAAPASAQAEPASRAYLGIAVEPSADADHPGVVVREVAPNSPAAKAGVQRGDVLARVGDQAIKDFETLIATVGKHRPGDRVTFHVKRDGQDKDLTVILAVRPDRPAPGGGAGTEKGEAFLGVHSQALSAEARARLGVKADTGALIVGVAPDSPAAKAGLQRGDVIAALNGKAIEGPAELRKLVREAGVGKEVRLTVQRGGEQKELTTTLQEAPVDGLSLFPLQPRPALPGLRELVPPVFGSAERMAELEKKVQDLERRVRELEGKQKPPSR